MTSNRRLLLVLIVVIGRIRAVLCSSRHHAEFAIRSSGSYLCERR
jgi:hypothetical protein